MPKNLWGIIPEAGDIRTPVTILREQADQLSDLTGGQIGGSVTVETNEGDYSATLGLVVPALNYYRYNILSVSGDMALFYPARIRFNLEGHGYNFASDEAEYLALLGTMLSSDQTKKVIHGLLVQVKDANDRKSKQKKQ